MKEYSEQELLEKLAEGDKFTFGIVYNTYYTRLYHFAQYYLNDEESSKDVIQEIFSITWEDYKKFAEVRNLSSWLFTLTKNQCLKRIEHLKVKQKHINILKHRQLGINQMSLNDLDTSPLVFEEIDSIIQQTLKSLSAQSRRIFELSRFENKKYHEIATLLNISQKSVEAHITKTLKHLRKALKNYLPFVLSLF